MSDKVVLVTESLDPVSVVDKENYILEGVFAVFGKENVNHRIYDEKEYMPHLEYLQEKIARHKLAGEMDHPEKFDVSLSNISHLVEKLWYDKDTRTLRGRIKVLDTEPAGMNARKLIDAGFPLSISSRAAGTVRDDKHVEIKRIFTYDLVADGGFGNDAELERVKESLDTDNTLKAIYESATAKPDLKSMKTNFDNVQVYDVTDKYGFMLDEGADWSQFDDWSGDRLEKSGQSEKVEEKVSEEAQNINIKNNNTMAGNVTIEDMSKYSRYVKQKVEEIESQLSALKEERKSLSSDSKLDENESNKLEEKIDDLKNYTEELVKEHNALIEFVNKFVDEHNELSEKVNLFERHSNEFVEEHNSLIKYCEAIADENEQIKGYLNEEVKPTVESSIKYSEYVAGNLQECMNYLDEEVAPNVNAQSEYLDKVVAESVTNIEKYQDYLAEKTNEVHAYANYLGENVASKEDLESVFGTGRAKKIEESNASSLDQKIDAILENVKITKAAKLVEASKYPFIKNFNSKEMREFASLNEAQKEMVSRRLTGNSNIDEVLNEAANLKSDKDWITNMPAEYEQAWNSLNESEKAAIEAQAQLYRLDTPYQIKNFWQTRGLEKNAKQNSLNESKDNKVDLGGYDSSVIERVRKMSKRYI